MSFRTNLKKVVVQSVLMFTALLFVSVTAQNSDSNNIGHFDISKVQAAVQDQNTNDQSLPVNKKQSESYVSVILRIIIYLALVIGVIFTIAWFIRKTGLGNSSRIGGGGSMDILEVLQFGQNRNALLVRVMDTVYLLGQTPTSIVLLEKIEGQKAIDLIASSKGGGAVMQFKDVFNNFMGKMKRPS